MVKHCIDANNIIDSRFNNNIRKRMKLVGVSVTPNHTCTLPSGFCLRKVLSLQLLHEEWLDSLIYSRTRQYQLLDLEILTL